MLGYMGSAKDRLDEIRNLNSDAHYEYRGKVQFKELQEAIDAIDEAMLGYMGTAKNRLDQVRSLNSLARSSYSKCVKPVFEWCIASNVSLHSIIPFIGSEKLTKHDRDAVSTMTLHIISMGLNHTANSLNLLNDVIQHTSDLRDLFKSIMHDIKNDFGVGGFYGKKRLELLDKSEREKKEQTIKTVFIALGVVIFSPVGVTLGLAAAVGTAVGTTDFDLWQKKTSYTDQVEHIDKLFQILQAQFLNVTELVEGIKTSLEEDKTNLHALRGKIIGASISHSFLSLDSLTMHALFIPSLTNVTDQCMKYITWHGYNSSIYEDNIIETRRVSFFTTLESKDTLVNNVDERPKTKSAIELENVEESKQIKHFSVESDNFPTIGIPQTSTIPSKVHMIATYFKHVIQYISN
nr:uncharacterized protein LOC122322051 [Drosophila bipectinata]